MRIAILSDTHDHIPNLRSAVTYCNAYSVQMMIHCGDLISPFMLIELGEFAGPVHLIYGNNVGDQHLISQSCGVKYPNITHHGTLGAVEAGGIKFAFNHYPQLARGIAEQGSFDVVCCGHTHRYHIEKGVLIYIRVCSNKDIIVAIVVSISGSISQCRIIT